MDPKALLALLERMQKHHGTTSLPKAIWNYGSREKAGEEGRQLWGHDVPAAIEALRRQVG